MKFIIFALLIGSIAITAQSASVPEELSNLVGDLTSGVGSGSGTGVLSDLLKNVNQGVLEELVKLIQNLLSKNGNISKDDLGTLEGLIKQLLAAVQKLSGNDSKTVNLQETLSSALEFVQNALSKSSDGNVPSNQQASVETVLESLGKALGGLTNGQN